MTDKKVVSLAEQRGKPRRRVPPGRGSPIEFRLTRQHGYIVLLAFVRGTHTTNSVELSRSCSILTMRTYTNGREQSVDVGLQLRRPVELARRAEVRFGVALHTLVQYAFVRDLMGTDARQWNNGLINHARLAAWLTAHQPLIVPSRIIDELRNRED